MSLSKSKITKLVTGFAGFALALGFAIAPAMASAQTSSAATIQAQINSLLATIQSLQAQLSATTGGTTTTMTSTTMSGYMFNTNLTLGSTGPDVMALQKFLNMSAATQVSTSGAGSPGMETSYFGPATQAAVAKFQVANGISPTAGYFGPVTRAKVNAMEGSMTTTTGTTTTGGTSTVQGCTSTAGFSPITGQSCATGATTVVGGSLVFAPGVQPANSLAPQNASRIPFTTFTLTNTGSTVATVNSITVQRTGLAADAAFNGVELLDQNGIQVGVSRTFDSNHQAILGNPFTLNPGQTETFTVAGNFAASETAYAGQVASLSVVGVNSTATVSGSFPVTGAQQTINASLTIGTATVYVSSYDPNSYRTESIGTTGLNFSGIRITAGSAEDEKLMSVTWNQSGSIGSNDLANLVTIVNGTSYPVTVDATGKYYTASFPGGILIPKGNTVDAYLKGDLVGNDASGRNIEFDIYRSSDIYLVGQTYGYGITPTPSSVAASYLPEAATAVGGTSIASSVFNTGNPFFEGSLTLVQPGTLSTISNGSAQAPAQNIAINVPNQVVGGFTTNFTGEPVTVQTMVFHVSSSTPGNQLTSVSLVDSNGNVVAGPVDEVDNTATLTFNNTVTFPVGVANYTLKGQVINTAPNGSTYQLSTNPGTDWTNAQGQTSGSTVTLPNGSIQFSTMTVEGPSLIVSAASSPAATNIAPGAQNYVFANINLDASQSGEDIRLSSLPISLTVTGAAVIGDLSSCQLWNGTTALNNTTVNGSTFTGTDATANFSFQNALTIPKGTVVSLSLSCNLSSSLAAGAKTYAAGVNTAVVPSPTGVQSGISLQQAGANNSDLLVQTSTSGIMTVGSASLAAIVDSSSPSYAVVAGGSAGVTIGVINLQPTSDAVNLTKIGLRLNSTLASSSDVSRAYIYNSANQQVGSVIFTGTPTANGYYYATSTLSSSLNLPQNVQTLLTIKADISAIGPGSAGMDGHKVVIGLEDANGSGVSSGAIVDSGPTATAVNGVGIFRSYPTLAALSVPTTLVQASGEILNEFSVTANSSNSISIDKINVNVATSTGGAVNGYTYVNNLKVYAYTDSGFSQPVSGFSSGLLATVPNLISTGTTTLSMGATPLVISQGATYYLKVVGDVTETPGTNGWHGTVQSYVAGDSVALPYPFMYSVAGLGTGADLVWSPNATTTSSVSTNDWTNGFGILGLPSTGMQATTLSN